MPAIDPGRSGFLYLQVMDFITDSIDSGVYRPGDRLPSLRHLSDQAGVSVPTVRQAYIELERQGRVRSRPKSGFFVRGQVRNRLVRRPSGISRACCPVDRRALIERVYAGIHREGVVPLGIANPSMARPAARALHRTMKRVMARSDERSLSYAPTDGEPTLRRQIAWRYVDLGVDVDPDEIIVTNGGQEALALALKSVAGPGDVIAVESPTYHGALELIESLDMLALEIETCPRDGVDPAALERALERHDVRGCLFASALNNPLGSNVPDENRKTIVGLLHDAGVALIEDDVYSELKFDGRRPRPARFYARDGNVLTCGSFSKTAAPGYRIGWILPGQHRDAVSRLKRAWSYSSGQLPQLTLSEFMASGDFDRHLAALRPVLRQNAERMRTTIAASFPSDTRVSRPSGGSVLWLELDRGVDSGRLFYRALDENISIAPGLVFSPRDRYRHCIRLSFGHPWSETLEAAVARLGALAAGAG